MRRTLIWRCARCRCPLRGADGGLCRRCAKYPPNAASDPATFREWRKDMLSVGGVPYALHPIKRIAFPEYEVGGVRREAIMRDLEKELFEEAERVVAEIGPKRKRRKKMRAKAVVYLDENGKPKDVEIDGAVIANVAKAMVNFIAGEVPNVTMVVECEDIRTVIGEPDENHDAADAARYRYLSKHGVKIRDQMRFGADLDCDIDMELVSDAAAGR